jgi:hypothetical protein
MPGKEARGSVLVACRHCAPISVQPQGPSPCRETILRRYPRHTREIGDRPRFPLSLLNCDKSWSVPYSLTVVARRSAFSRKARARAAKQFFEGIPGTPAASRDDHRGRHGVLLAGIAPLRRALWFSQSGQSSLPWRSCCWAIFTSSSGSARVSWFCMSFCSCERLRSVAS